MIIAHRGLLYGPDKNAENHPSTIAYALNSGFAVEVDVWYENGFLLGHDCGRYSVNMEYLQQENLWVHCKNIEALVRLSDSKVHCFWHENDSYTLTNRGYVWCYPGKPTPASDNAVLVLPERSLTPEYSISDLFRDLKHPLVCTDYGKILDDLRQDRV